ncbi:DUF3224 domain-containing protein [Blastococcus sp. TF02A-26]|uniref:DUF3224 domain-containing protein n=1 Tax=Blastococcus sp. TF02A-26 TaxID=2250577 RepID=UPI001313FA09|nr:DUF3224 domain-containing protein [Blastococcus sp. TF02A-26]
MGTVVRIPFEVTAWEPEPLDLGEPGPVGFGRVTLRKTFSGPLTGSSVVAMTSATVGEAPAGYVAVELVTGTLEGRSGTFVLQHSGVVDGGDSRATGVVLPGTGTGALAGLRGDVELTHDDSGAVLTLDYELS